MVSGLGMGRGGSLESLVFPAFARTIPPECPAVAVGVSGGSDSMALLALLSRWFAECKADGTLHAITFDHGLRPESSGEAAQVRRWVEEWPHTRPVTLSWEGTKPQSRILESARRARYDAMLSYCRQAGIRNVFLAHHRNDQAETFLMRLAAGSGLDGLCGMSFAQNYEELTLFRPLLGTDKADLVAYCTQAGIPFVEDPSNANARYLRPRLRAVESVLAREGLTPARLGTVCDRLRRAREALEAITAQAYAACLIAQAEEGRIAFDLACLSGWPEDIRLRVLLQGAARLSSSPLRLEKMETIAWELFDPAPFRTRTQSGLIFAREDKQGRIILRGERACRKR